MERKGPIVFYRIITKNRFASLVAMVDKQIQEMQNVCAYATMFGFSNC